MKANNKVSIFSVLMACCLLLSACATGRLIETSTPALDKDFGTSLKVGKEAQKIAKDPNKPDVPSEPTSKELALPYDNFVKGKGAASPILERPFSSNGGS